VRVDEQQESVLFKVPSRGQKNAAEKGTERGRAGGLTNQKGLHVEDDKHIPDRDKRPGAMGGRRPADPSARRRLPVLSDREDADGGVRNGEE